jgi:predicted  nucleic acid-binding Zn-ribbon protein
MYERGLTDDLRPMHQDLQNLIRLQKLDFAAEEARRTVHSAPDRIAALDALLHSAQEALAAAKARKADNEERRRGVEKDRSAIRARRSKYQDQTMEVKTNREFHALQHEIETADQEIARLDDQDLELMVAADEIAAAIKSAEAGLRQADKDIAAERAGIEAQVTAAKGSLEELARERASVTADLPAPVLTLFEGLVRTRKGLAIVEAKDGLCLACNVKMRVQTFGEVRRNDRIIQCESCKRILYYVPPPAPQPQPGPAA